MSGSFFGFDTALPKGGGRQKNKGKKVEYGVPLDDDLFAIDALNDQTFGSSSLENIDKDFDFTASNKLIPERPLPPQNKRAPPGFKPTNTIKPAPGLSKPMEIWNEPNVPGPAFGVNISLDDLFGPPAPNQETPVYPKKVDWESIKLERRKARLLKEEKMAKEAKFMCQNDKDFVLRVQLSQLVSNSDSLKVDDFYFEMFNSFTGTIGNVNDKGNEQGNNGRGHKNNELQKMQKQLAKVVADTKRRQENSKKGLENALGKVAQKSSRNPKMVLQVSHQRSPSEGLSSGLDILNGPGANAQRPASLGRITNLPYRSSFVSQTPLERKKTALLIEKMYVYLLEIEQLARNRPILKYGTNEERAKLDEWARNFESVCIDLWETFGIGDEGNSYSIVHFLNSAKGKKLILRYGRLMSRDHTLNFISVLLSHFEDLNVVKNGICPPKGRLPPIITDEIELFLSSVLPLVMAYISEAPLVIVNGLLSILMEKNNVVAISRSKVGLAFLTIFLTRIEVLRQSGGSFIGMMAPSPEVPLARSSELFSNLFNSLQNHFLAIFPSLMSQIDDLYAWQFLASLSVGLNLDQQHTLVLELRDKVIEQITLASRGHLPSDVAATKITNVNLFLHALGLDASQVNV